MDKFAEELNKIGITLTDIQREQFDRYYELLVERNKVMNLTGITEYDEVLGLVVVALVAPQRL